MKTVLLSASMTMVQFFLSVSSASVLPLDTILGKTSALAGNSIISVEQNVIFNDGSKDFVIKENWLIEGDKNLKLNAAGTGELKDLFKIHALYNGEKITEVIGKNRTTGKLSPDFFERFLAIKSRDSYMNYLNEMGVAPKVRLSRAGGTISFAIGNPSTEKALSPQFWIAQEYFQLMKIRFPSEAEVEFSDYQEFGKLNYPMLKKISWAGKSVKIRVLDVSTKTSATLKDFYPETLDLPSESNLSSKGSIAATIQEFYKRFR